MWQYNWFLVYNIPMMESDLPETLFFNARGRICWNGTGSVQGLRPNFLLIPTVNFGVIGDGIFVQYSFLELVLQSQRADWEKEPSIITTRMKKFQEAKNWIADSTWTRRTKKRFRLVDGVSCWIGSLPPKTLNWAVKCFVFISSFFKFKRVLL